MEETIECIVCESKFIVEEVDCTGEVQYCCVCGMELLEEGEEPFGIFPDDED